MAKFPPPLTSELIERLRARFGLPLHIYFPAEVAHAAGAFREAAAELYPDADILFAVKSNPCPGAVAAARNCGLGADVVSEYELAWALEAGIPADRIVCNGNAKTDAYLKAAIACGAVIAADSLDEVSLIAALAKAANRMPRVLIRLVGMALEGLTAAEQTTAARWTKFGIDYRAWRKFLEIAASSEHIIPAGISAHIGTQVCDPAGYERLMTGLLSVVEAAYSQGWRMQMIDIGGGFPLSYMTEEEWNLFRRRLRLQIEGKLKPNQCVTWGGIDTGYEYLKEERGKRKEESSALPAWHGKAYWSPKPGAQMLAHLLGYGDGDGPIVAQRLREAGAPRLLIEPGRALFGEAGATLAYITGVKEVEGNTLVVVDLGIVNHGTLLITPDIYPMQIWPPLPEDAPVEAFVAGRLCFTGDMITKVKVTLNRLPKRGDILIIGMTGAYSADHFASRSCGFPLPPKVAVQPDGSFERWRD